VSVVDGIDADPPGVVDLEPLALPCWPGAYVAYMGVRARGQAGKVLSFGVVTFRGSNHRQDTGPDRIGQRVPGVDDGLQVGIRNA
jgi:hypothetical protein